MRKPKLTPEQRDKLQAMYKRGDLVIDIAAYFKISIGTVSNYARALNLARRRGKGGTKERRSLRMILGRNGKLKVMTAAEKEEYLGHNYAVDHLAFFIQGKLAAMIPVDRVIDPTGRFFQEASR